MSESKSPGVSSLAARLVAELGIIVLGVLIALWADGWVSDRQDRDKETARLEALRDNVVATRERIETSRELADFVVGKLREVAYWEDLENFEEEKLGVLVPAYLAGPEFTPQMNVYDDLQNSGELALLTSDALRQALARMRSELDELQLSHDDLLTVQQLNFDPFAVQYIAISPATGFFLGLENLPVDPQPELPELRIIRNLALFKLDLLTELLEDYDAADEALQDVLSEIDAYAN